MKPYNYNQSNEFLSLQQLEALIEKYFDGETSELDEKLLKSELAKGKFHTPIVEEATAILGLFAVGSKRAKKHAVTIKHRYWLRYAATLILLFATAATWYVIEDRRTNRCEAYINGVKINDDNKVMSMMQSDLNTILNASNDADAMVNGQMNDVIEMMNSEE